MFLLLYVLQRFFKLKEFEPEICVFSILLNYTFNYNTHSVALMSSRIQICTTIYNEKDLKQHGTQQLVRVQLYQK